MWPYASVGWGFGHISAVTAFWEMLTALLSRCGLLERVDYGLHLNIPPLFSSSRTARLRVY